MLRKFVVFSGITLLCFASIGCSSVSNSSSETRPKNIIMVVGDGMGPAFTTGYRYFADDPATDAIETTVFDRLLVGSASTYPAPESGIVTDSAAAATALATGVKSYNGAIAVDTEKRPVPTVLEMAKQARMHTGLVVTSQIVHATPAAYMVHNEHRKNYNAIADQFFDQRIDGQFTADVMLGGGWQYFLREDRDLVGAFRAEGFNYVDDPNLLSKIDSKEPLLGLFADVGLPWALDYPEKTRLLPMVKTAVELLDNDKGYFLLIEASQIDWAGHANDIASAMAEMADLAETLSWLEGYVSERDDTLMVITADHSTGGLTLARDRDYLWAPQILSNLSSSPESFAKSLVELANEDRKPAIMQWLGKGSSAGGFTFDEAAEKEIEALLPSELLSVSDAKVAYTLIKQMIDSITHTGWTTGGHTAIDVQVMAAGVGKEQFYGHQDNTDIAKKLMQFLPKPQSQQQP